MLYARFTVSARSMTTGMSVSGLADVEAPASQRGVCVVANGKTRNKR